MQQTCWQCTAQRWRANLNRQSRIECDYLLSIFESHNRLLSNDKEFRPATGINNSLLQIVESTWIEGTIKTKCRMNHGHASQSTSNFWSISVPTQCLNGYQYSICTHKTMPVLHHWRKTDTDPSTIWRYRRGGRTSCTDILPELPRTSVSATNRNKISIAPKWSTPRAVCGT